MSPEDKMPIKSIELKPIGIIHSPFKAPKGVPIQPTAGKDVQGTVEVFPEYAGGLKDLDGFSHIMLVCYFHLAKEYSLEVIPFMDDQLRGVFATRAPSRPNPIGISVVRLDKIEGNILHIRDLDIVDGTPLLDIKPHVSEFVSGEIQKIGWLEHNMKKLPKTKDNGRFTE
jgi:tRNA-Thr(GGU) m(6)t(6)A37 methyltransferase TsaA